MLQAGGAESDDSTRKALAAFCEAYWPPLYTFLRRRGYSQADAQDIVQGFFEHLFQHNTLSRADQEKGRLRTFLLGSLQNFLLKQHERRSAIKRGGAHQFVSFDEQLPQAEAAMQATSHLSDMNSYDVAWASSIVTRAWKNVTNRRTGFSYACWLCRAKKNTLSQPATAARNLPYEPGATSQNQERIPRLFRQRFHDVSTSNVINGSNHLCHSINL